ncbi:MAG: alkaline phosphatase family protein [Bacillota bacterium]
MSATRRNLIIIGLLFVAVVGLALARVLPSEGRFETVHPLVVSGDVENVVELGRVDEEDFSLRKAERDDRRLLALALSDVLEAAEPRTPHYRVLFVGSDGRSAEISGDHLEDNLLALGEEYGWEAINPSHPVSSNIKDLTEILVVAEDPPPDVTVNISREGETLKRHTVGELLADGYGVRSRSVGSSTQVGGELSLKAEIFQRERVVDLRRLAGDVELQTVLLVGEMGEMVSVSAGSQVILGDNSLSYREDADSVVPAVRGVILDPPKRYNTDIYHDAVRSLEDGEDTMIVLVDGFGWHQYRHLVEREALPYLGSVGEAAPALAVFPSITPVNLTAAITGVLPAESGVVARDTRRPEVETIFMWCRERGLKERLVMGPIAPIEAGTDPVFSSDSDGDGSDDDEVFENALNMVEQDYDLLMVHFKGVDSAGHTHGALAEETLDTAVEIDGYIERLAESWDGRILVFADHGMKTIDDGGEHRLCVYEDMYVPHWDIPPTP